MRELRRLFVRDRNRSVTCLCVVYGEPGHWLVLEYCVDLDLHCCNIEQKEGSQKHRHYLKISMYTRPLPETNGAIYQFIELKE